MLSREQTIQVDNALRCLEEARNYLDNAMYGLGDIDDESYNKLRKIYDSICKIQDNY